MRLLLWCQRPHREPRPLAAGRKPQRRPFPLAGMGLVTARRALRMLVKSAAIVNRAMLTAALMTVRGNDRSASTGRHFGVGLTVRIAVAGAGVIGKRHIEEVVASASAELDGIVDPGPGGPELARKYNVPLHRSLTELFEANMPDGVILATPNQMHVEGGLECVSAGVPVLVEKPIGDTVAGAMRLVEAAEQAGVVVLTGHHRNYSPIMAKAR